ncbi:MAG TPA: copper resistance protein CopC, partial [Thermomicrobiales bacterium]|nr:copper resistance protein CopC [Thermomicrobiales bacterium]
MTAPALTRRFAGEPRWRAVVALALVVGWFASAVAAPLAAAHAFLASSDPAANAVLTSAPTAATLKFTEPIEQSYSQAQLFDQTGKQISGAAIRFGGDGATLILSLPSGLKHGTYSILWRSLSAADAHTAQGYLAFTIGAEADVRTIVPPPATEASIGPPEWVKALSRWLALLGLAAVVAVWPVWLWVLRPAIAPVWRLGPRLTRRVRRFAAAAFVVALVGNAVALVVQALSASADQGFAANLTSTLRQTRYGSFWLVRLGLLLVFAAALLGVGWWRPRRRPV